MTWVMSTNINADNDPSGSNRQSLLLFDSLKQSWVCPVHTGRVAGSDLLVRCQYFSFLAKKYPHSYRQADRGSTALTWIVDIACDLWSIVSYLNRYDIRGEQKVVQRLRQLFILYVKEIRNSPSARHLNSNTLMPVSAKASFNLWTKKKIPGSLSTTPKSLCKFSFE